VPHLRLAFAALALAASAGLMACDRPDDLPHKRDEVLATARRYDARFEELKHRAEKLTERDRALPPSTPNLAANQHRVGEALTAIEQNRSYLQKVPSDLEGWTKAGNARDLQKLLDALRERMDDGVRSMILDLSEVESWTGLVEQGILQAQPTPQPMPEAPNEPDEPDEPGNDRDPARAPVR
jgi:hypothetical protein